MDQAKRECILVAAARAFATHGFRKASVDDIAKSAGVAKGTVYLACESKEDLFYQAVHRELRQWIAETAKLIDPRKPADELLLAAVATGANFLQTHPLVRELFEGKYNELLPKWIPRFEELRALGRKNAEEILTLGIKQGRFRKSLDVQQVSLLLQDINISMLVFSRLNPAQDFLQRMPIALDLILNGLRDTHFHGTPSHIP